MKLIYNGKRYDTTRCVDLASSRHYSPSNNYSGTTTLIRASDGQLILYTWANGQDCWLSDSVEIVSRDEARDWMERTNASIEDGADVKDLIEEVP